MQIPESTSLYDRKKESLGLAIYGVAKPKTKEYKREIKHFWWKCVVKKAAQENNGR